MNIHVGFDSTILDKINIQITVAIAGKRLRVINPNLLKLYSLGSPTKRNSGGSTFALICENQRIVIFDI